MNEKRRKMDILIKFSETCQTALKAQPKPNRSHRRSLEVFRPKLQVMLADPVFKRIAENRLKILNVVLHYANSGDDVQLERSLTALSDESKMLFDQLNRKGG